MKPSRIKIAAVIYKFLGVSSVTSADCSEGLAVAHNGENCSHLVVRKLEPYNLRHYSGAASLRPYVMGAPICERQDLIYAFPFIELGFLVHVHAKVVAVGEGTTIRCRPRREREEC